jgi:hypothetical protein
LPYAVSRWALKRVNGHRPVCGVLFPPLGDRPGQPRQLGIGLKTRVRHYLNLSRMEGRLGRLLKDFSWDRMDRIFLPDGAPRECGDAQAGPVPSAGQPAVSVRRSLDDAAGAVNGMPSS